MEQVQTIEERARSRFRDEAGGEQRIAMSYEEYLNSFEDSTQVEWV